MRKNVYATERCACKNWVRGVGLKILIVYNFVDLAGMYDPNDIFTQQDTELVETAMKDALELQGHEVVMLPIRHEIWTALAPFNPREWLIFNLCEALREQPYLEPYVISIYEYLGFRYTGSGRKTLANCLSKPRTKQILLANGVATAPFRVLSPENNQCDLTFPLFVKPTAEDASLGITLRSVVRNTEELNEQVVFIWEKFRQPALVESFLDGREFNVTIMGNDSPRVLPLSEISFKKIADPLARIVTYQGKWVSNSDEYRFTTAQVPAKVSDRLHQRITETAMRAYRVMGVRDYGRVDIRVKDDVPYVLEVNPNADLSPGAGIPNAARVAGMNYADLGDEIIRLAARRYNLGAVRPRIFSLPLRATNTKGHKNQIKTQPRPSVLNERTKQEPLLANA